MKQSNGSHSHNNELFTWKLIANHSGDVSRLSHSNALRSLANNGDTLSRTTWWYELTQALSDASNRSTSIRFLCTGHFLHVRIQEPEINVDPTNHCDVLEQQITLLAKVVRCVCLVDDHDALNPTR